MVCYYHTLLAERSCKQRERITGQCQPVNATELDLEETGRYSYLVKENEMVAEVQDQEEYHPCIYPASALWQAWPCRPVVL